MISQALSWIGRRMQPAAEPLERIAPTLNVRNDITGVLSSDREGMMELFQIPTHAGPAVTVSSAMQVSAVYAAISLIAGAIASLPLNFYQRTDGAAGRKRVKHDLWWLFNEQPSPLIPAAVFWEYIIATKILHGDGFALLVRDRNFKIVEALPLSPLEVQTERRRNELVYYVSSEQLGTFGVKAEDMLHFHGFGFNLRTGRGLSVIRHVARQAIGNALAADEFAGRFFANGAQPSHVITFPAGVKDEQITSLKDRWAERRAGVANAGKPLILTNGATVKELTMTLEDAQLLETRRFQVEDIARALGVPPYMIGSTEKVTSWGSGIEQMGQGFVTFTLQRHLGPAEQEINRKCFSTATYFAEFNVDGLQRGDLKARGAYYRQAIGGSQGPGWLSANEIRQKENEEPADGGEDLFMPTAAQMTAPPPEPGDDNAAQPPAA
jgi:HK97 family phage portal protein